MHKSAYITTVFPTDPSSIPKEHLLPYDPAWSLRLSSEVIHMDTHVATLHWTKPSVHQRQCRLRTLAAVPQGIRWRSFTWCSIWPFHKMPGIACSACKTTALPLSHIAPNLIAKPHPSVINGWLPETRPFLWRHPGCGMFFPKTVSWCLLYWYLGTILFLSFLAEGLTYILLCSFIWVRAWQFNLY